MVMKVFSSTDGKSWIYWETSMNLCSNYSVLVINLDDVLCARIYNFENVREWIRGGKSEWGVGRGRGMSKETMIRIDFVLCL